MMKGQVNCPTWSVDCTRCATTMPVASRVFMFVTFCRFQSCPDGMPMPMYMLESVPLPRYNSLCHGLSGPRDAVLGSGPLQKDDYTAPYCTTKENP